MRILHTSDWHLGKRLFKLDRTQEHQLFLNWLVSVLVEKSIDLLLIAGDIFDTPTPPHQSMEMFYEFLHRVSVETKTHTLIIAGNHDSGLLLEAPSKILKPHRVKVWGKLSTEPMDHWHLVRVGQEAIEICAIPFFRSYELLPQGEGDALEALKRYLTKERTVPQVLMLHHLAGIAEAGGSEQVINLTGVNFIPLETLRSFDYVALGHIHKAQPMGKTIRYSGSPLSMRFSETQHSKSVVLLNYEQNSITQEILPIPLFRKLLCLHLKLENYAEKISELPESNDELQPMVEVQITLSQPTVGLIDEIKELLEARGYEMLSYQPTYSEIRKTERRHQNLFELSPIELFSEFYQQKYPDAKEIPEDLLQDFKTLVEKVGHASSKT
jgi:DNA repair protein SbcD/Mre11